MKKPSKITLELLLTVGCTALVILLTVFTLPRSGNKPAGAYLRFEPYGDGYRITEYTGELTSLTIPDTYRRKPVLRIDDGVFGNDLNLREVVIPESVIEIGTEAFMECRSLIRLSINGCAHIGERAFEGCRSILFLELNGTVSISPRAFARCSDLIWLDLPPTLTVISDSAFEDCCDLTDVVFPDSLTYIGSRAFANCSLKSVKLGSGPVEVDDLAFENCRNIKQVELGGAVRLGRNVFPSLHIEELVLPDSLTAMEDEAFSNSHIRSLHIGSGLEEFGDRIFYGISGLERVTVSPDNKILRHDDGVLFSCDMTRLLLYPAMNHRTEYTVPDGVTEIGFGAFSGAINLTSITLPDSLRVVRQYAFSDCKALTALAIPEGVSELESLTFSCCESLAQVQLPESLRVIDRFAFNRCSSLTEIELPETLEALEAECFSGCPITSVHLGSELREIGPNPFSAAPVLSITVSPENRHFRVIDGCLYTMDGRELILYPTGSPAKSHTIPEGVEVIRYGAFGINSNLRVVVLPDSLQNIGDYAFFNCYRLESVKLPDGTESIGSSAFGYCQNLRSVDIPASVTHIDKDAFTGSGNVRIICPRDSYAWEYCAENNIAHAEVPDEAI